MLFFGVILVRAPPYSYGNNYISTARNQWIAYRYTRIFCSRAGFCVLLHARTESCSGS